jgi:hypothetical protein
MMVSVTPLMCAVPPHLAPDADMKCPPAPGADVASALSPRARVRCGFRSFARTLGRQFELVRALPRARWGNPSDLFLPFASMLAWLSFGIHGRARTMLN